MYNVIYTQIKRHVMYNIIYFLASLADFRGGVASVSVVVVDFEGISLELARLLVYFVVGGGEANGVLTVGVADFVDDASLFGEAFVLPPTVTAFMIRLLRAVVVAAVSF